MNPSWQQYLLETGAVFEDGRIIGYGAAENPLRRGDALLMDLSHLGILEISGKDAINFLQGQLCNDITQVTLGQGQYSGYCTPKGRMLANFVVWHAAPGSDAEPNHYLQLRQELCAGIGKRLSMYILRAKVSARDLSDTTVRFGVVGPAAANLIKDLTGVMPQGVLETAHAEDVTVISHGMERYEVVTTPQHAEKYWRVLLPHVQLATSSYWDWLEIKNGIANLTQATQDQFIPQMLNFDLIGGVSFKKGCYPGQEIVARTQYLGKLKRRLFLASVASSTLPIAGDPLFGPHSKEEPIGMVVNAEISLQGEVDLLAVIQVENALNTPVFWKTANPLHFLPLPYANPSI